MWVAFNFNNNWDENEHSRPQSLTESLIIRYCKVGPTVCPSLFALSFVLLATNRDWMCKQNATLIATSGKITFCLTVTVGKTFPFFTFLSTKRFGYLSQTLYAFNPNFSEIKLKPSLACSRREQTSWALRLCSYIKHSKGRPCPFLRTMPAQPSVPSFALYYKYPWNFKMHMPVI